MLNFEVISLSDKQKYESRVNEKLKLNSISDFNFFYLWNTNNNIEIAFCEQFAIIKGNWGNKKYFYSPSIATVEDFDAVYKLVENYQNGENFYLAALDKDIIDQIKCIPNGASIKFDRNASDYIYSSTDLINLQGKKFHAKKNFVNSFIKNYQYEFVTYDESYFDGILNLYDNWTTHSEHSVDKNERIAIERALKNYKELGLIIGVLLINGSIAAFSVSAISTHNVAQVFFEKADTSYKGIYAMINNLTASKFLSGVEYINREEDMGIEGLRKAKLSYNPVIIYEKYILEQKYE